MSLQVWLPLNQGPENVITDISNFGKESGISITADTNGWYKIADSSHTSSRWGIYKDFYVKSNTTYTLNVYAKSTTGVTANVGIQSFNGYTGWPTQREIYNGSSEKLITFTWTTAATDNYARVYLAMNPSSTVANNYVFYKGVEILEAPEIKNQGLDTIAVITNNTNNFQEEGKISNTSLDVSGHYAFRVPSLVKKRVFSCAFWYKPITDSSLSDNWRKIIVFDTYTSDGSTTGAIFRFESSYGYQSSSTTYCISIHNNVGEPIASIGTGLGETDGWNKWHHITITADGTTLRCYRNGIQVATGNMNNGGMLQGIVHIGYSGNRPIGRLNDFRLYDNCLSPEEVKKISQGLLLHYPLNRKGFGQDNILINTHFDSRYSQTTGWDTTKNGTLMASSWGGYNSGVTNQATVYHAHLKEFNGEWVYEYIKTANESWLGISQGGLQSKLTAGKTYTFSWEEYHVDGVNRVGTGLYYYKTGATSANFHLGIKQASEVTRDIGRWQKYTYTFTAPNDADWSKNMSWYVYGHYNGNGTFYLRHIKLEEGSIPTPWSPNPTDIFINLFDFNSTLEYDTSGFNNHGTRIGAFDWTSDTPKYSVSQVFSGSQRIEAPFNPGNSPTFTVAGWFYHTSGTTYYGAKNDYNTFICLEGGRYFVYNSPGSASVGNWTSTANTWQHVVLVHDATTKKLKLYVNGSFVSEVTTNGTICGSDILDIGGRQGTAQYSGKISDFRIYATALSASDVLELYNNKNF